MSEPVLVLDSVVKRYRGREVLAGVDLSVAKGETVGFVGRNGAGKTTCLRLLSGLSACDAGAVRSFGLDPARHGPAVRQRCSYMPGEHGLYGNLTGREMLRFALHFYPQRDAELVERMVDGFQLPLQRKVRHYSAGMKQQLALTAALAVEVDAYLLDEPDRHLDPPARLLLRDLIRELQARGKSILFSSHHLGEVDAVAHRLAFLLEGRIVDDARIERARQALRRVVRLRLRNGGEVPGGVDAVTTDPDGSVRVVPRGDPLRWLAGLDAARVETVEVGATRLEEIYRLIEGGGES